MASRLVLLLLPLLALPGVLTQAAQASPPVADQNLWYSLYFQSVHSGYSHVTSHHELWHGVPAIREDSQTVTNLTVFGTTIHQNVNSSSYSSPKTGEPFFQSFTMESGGSTTDVEATFTHTAVTAILKSGTETTTKVIPIPAGEKIVDGDSEGMDSTGPMKVGETESDFEFNPVTLALDKEVSVVKAVNVPLKDARDGHIHSTAKVLVTEPEGSATAYQDSAGTPLLLLMPASLSMVCTDMTHAVSADSSQAAYATDPTAPDSGLTAPYSPSSDLAVTTAVSPTGLKLTNERSLQQLTVKLTIAGHAPKIVTETAIAVPPPDSSQVSTLSNSQTITYLQAAPYLTKDDPAIRAVVQSVVGNQTDAYQVVKLIHDWVYANMSPVGSLGLPRSATDVLADKQGVCRDYAVLYTTLARCAGIPTKVNAGLVGYKGHFYYHAWASSYIGGSVGWISVDPTLPTMFVDASHIPLGSGDATVMFDLTGVIGNTKIETLNMRNSL